MPRIRFIYPNYAGAEPGREHSSSGIGVRSRIDSGVQKGQVLY